MHAQRACIIASSGSSAYAQTTTMSDQGPDGFGLPGRVHTGMSPSGALRAGPDRSSTCEGDTHGSFESTTLPASIQRVDTYPVNHSARQDLSPYAAGVFASSQSGPHFGNSDAERIRRLELELGALRRQHLNTPQDLPPQAAATRHTSAILSGRMVQLARGTPEPLLPLSAALHPDVYPHDPQSSSSKGQSYRQSTQSTQSQFSELRPSNLPLGHRDRPRRTFHDPHPPRRDVRDEPTPVRPCPLGTDGDASSPSPAEVSRGVGVPPGDPGWATRLPRPRVSRRDRARRPARDCAIARERGRALVARPPRAAHVHVRLIARAARMLEHGLGVDAPAYRVRGACGVRKMSAKCMSM